jgi:hypothetical protein
MAFHASDWLRLFRSQPTTSHAPALGGIEYRSAVDALADAGFWIVRDAVHVVMTDGKRILTIPRNNPIHSITMEGIVRDAGLTAEHFRELL